MFRIGKSERVEHRKMLISSIINDYDEQLLGENHMISMEHCPHWKTGKITYFDYDNMVIG